MAKQYVKYEDVEKGLHRPGHCGWADRIGQEWGCHPGAYLRLLRRETGLSWEKLAHDLTADSGCKVSANNARRWANG